MKIEIRDITIEGIIKLRGKDIQPAEYEDFKEIITNWVNDILLWGLCELLKGLAEEKIKRG